MRPFRFLVLLSLFILSLLSNVVSAQGGIVASVQVQMTLRVGPGTEWRRVGVLPVGMNVALDGRDHTGLWVRGITQNSEIGWMAGRYLSIGTDAVFALPIIDREAPIGVGAPPGGQAPASAPANTTDNSAPVNAQAITSTAPVTGFAYGGQVADFSDYAANLMHGAGMTWVKRQVVYDRGADPSSVSWMINDAHNRGFRILLSVIGHPQDINDPSFFGQYAGFLGGLAGGGADAIEVWNEMNIDREWPAGQINPASYTQMLAQAYNAIKASNSNTLVISGAPAPTGFFGGCHGGGCDDAQYIAGMAAAGAGNYLDCVGIHYNEGIISPHQRSGDPRSEHYTRYFWGMVNAYRASFNKPLCFTELGYLTPEGYGALPGNFAWAGNTSVGQQAAWLTDAISLSAGSGAVRLVIVWNVDFNRFDSDPQAGYAIIRPGGACPACETIGR